MREIKFQVFTEDWKGVKKCFDCYYLYLLEEIPLSFGTPKDGRWYKVAFTNSEGDKETVVVDRGKIRMFTGLKDKNGKEIYEGDIDTDEHGNLNVVCYIKKYGAYCFVPLELYVNEDYENEDYENEVMYQYGYDCFFHNIVPSEFAEVIGNIYENPELLEWKE